LVLRDFLEQQLVEHQDAVNATIQRIIHSPRQLPKLLLLYARCNWEIQVPQTLIVERERVARIAEQAARMRELEEAEDLEDELNHMAAAHAATTHQPDLPSSKGEDEPTPAPVDTGIPVSTAPPQAAVTNSAVAPAPPPTRAPAPTRNAQAELERLRQARRGGAP
jgi:hypothetical protein